MFIIAEFRFLCAGGSFPWFPQYHSCGPRAHLTSVSLYLYDHGPNKIYVHRHVLTVDGVCILMISPCASWLDSRFRITIFTKGWQEFYKVLNNKESSCGECIYSKNNLFTSAYYFTRIHTYNWQKKYADKLKRRVFCKSK